MHTVSPRMHSVIPIRILQCVRESNNDYWLMTMLYQVSNIASGIVLYSNSFFLVIQATLIVPVAAGATKSTSFLTSTAV